jgi:dTDP-4-amino-4,6-dideoxygalactose transaminase
MKDIKESQIDSIEKLYVAQPFLPDLNRVVEMLKSIWESKILTNEGPLHNQLEDELRTYLKVPVAKLYASGTTALLCALRSFDLPEGAEIITTPLTFAATPHAISFCGYKPVFADVLEDSLTIDPASVELAVTERTAAVLGVHVYSTICDTPKLGRVCQEHDLKLIFDAAHAFGASVDGTPVGMLGDATIFSLHATKIYHTLEGGIITTPHEDLAERLRLVRNFGIVDEATVTEIGINGKMNEFSAAIGLLNLPLVAAEREVRKSLRGRYDAIIADQPGLRRQIHQPKVEHSQQYYLMIVDPETFGRTRDQIYDALKERGVYARRYFWPTCNDYKAYEKYPVYSTLEQPVVEKVKNQLLCLPFHSGVKDFHVDIIADVLHNRTG